MTVTERLRALLDERGVEWEVPASSRFDTVVGDNWFHEYDCGITVHCLTPEQAVEATLGSAARHPKPHEQWTTVLLSEIAWDRDDRWPDYLSVAHDAHGEWRVYVPDATPGRGTCRMETDDSCQNWNSCSECGADYYTDQLINFCPNCGRKVVRA